MESFGDGFFGKGNTQYVFLFIIIILIIFIVYKGIKKKKTEKIEQKKRETEVIWKIKEHLLKTEDIKNISINFVKVLSRTGKLYKYRDVFDVFVEIKNIKKNLILKKKAYEIEGEAVEDKKGIVNIKWFINKEFDFDKHLNLIEKIPNSSWKIFLKSLKIKNKSKRKEWRKEQNKKLINWKKEQEIRHKEIEKRSNSKDFEEVFKPKIKKK